MRAADVDDHDELHALQTGQALWGVWTKSGHGPLVSLADAVVALTRPRRCRR